MSKPLRCVVHGGAWAISESDTAEVAAGSKLAAAAGYAVLTRGGSAIDAVEAAIRVLETAPVFDAGTGSVLNAAGLVEMDALLCDGRTLASGAIVGIDNVAHPISVARKVMDSTPHAMLAGTGAREFAAACGEPMVDPSSLVTEASRVEWNLQKDYASSVQGTFVNDCGGASSTCHDTVGCVALDAGGNVAAGTSTGGICMKMVGRVGDSPLFGCGGYADNAVGACSTTGHGESIIKVMLAANAVNRLDAADSSSTSVGATVDVSVAARGALTHMRDRVRGYGGLILLRPNGDFSIGHTTTRMAWAFACGDSAATSPEATQLASGYVAPDSSVDGVYVLAQASTLT